jgi:predicted CoA-binding protein
LGASPFDVFQPLPNAFFDPFAGGPVVDTVDQAIQMKVPVIWMQEGVVHEKAAQKARQAGIFVIMDTCILKEHRARFG